MQSKPVLLIGLVTALALLVLVVLTAVLVPEKTHPAYAAATQFMNAAGTGDEDTAFALLDEPLQAYVRAHCPDGRVSACIDAYTPPEWGRLLKAVYRRSIPDGAAWDVLLVATYAEDKGFAGVCIYHRLEEIAPGGWRVTAWSGFVPCDDSDAGLQSLRRADAPHRAP